ncbi:DinB family protein [Sediminibacterium soli]|uniref:DinB family protein n=1 Tax=Sediminibacterium soli TaxID=2698829 RepID=UPI001379790C|nr:DinB family protein [Sediminibacterium soli]NCI45832.1 DinB family protein [Sediminibacterium soli]
MSRPKPTDFPEYFGKYISKVATDSLAEATRTYADALAAFYTAIPEAKALHRYAPDKWTLKEVLQHVIDTEHVMSYRLLRIARKDKTPLASFDENLFSENSLANERSFDSLKEEFLALRKSTDLLIASLNEEQLAASGTASNKAITANSLGYIIYGHLLHHQQIIEERY